VAGGQSNPTYFLDFGARRFVLRKKPPGTLLPSAHAIDREFRVQSALARSEFKDFGNLCFRLGFEVLYNKTSTPFLTSDNPVCSYNPRQALHARTPYDHSGKVELIFPITARMLVRGSSKRGPVNMISWHRDVLDSRKVRQLNRTIAQFSYRMTIGQDRSSDDLIRAHATLVPTITTEVRRRENEVQTICRNVFGPRPVLSQYIDTPEKAARLKAKVATAFPIETEI
ncbi:MAG: DUF4238 domain-containing protein, partial [Rhizobiaceae bacterium]